jgi:hypothetical protein
MVCETDRAIGWIQNWIEVVAWRAEVTPGWGARRLREATGRIQAGSTTVARGARAILAGKEVDAPGRGRQPSERLEPCVSFR